MIRDGPVLKLSATDLAGHLACRHLTDLERLTAEGRRRPPIWRDPMLEVLQERGLAHERAYLQHPPVVAADGKPTVPVAEEQGVEVIRLILDSTS